MPEVCRLALNTVLSTLAAALTGACATTAEGPPGELRVIVQFSRSVTPSDPELLKRLERATNTSVRLSSMISDTEAAYWLRCTVRDPTCDALMGRLMEEPRVMNVQPDRFRYPSDPPR